MNVTNYNIIIMIIITSSKLNVTNYNHNEDIANINYQNGNITGIVVTQYSNSILLKILEHFLSLT